MNSITVNICSLFSISVYKKCLIREFSITAGMAVEASQLQMLHSAFSGHRLQNMEDIAVFIGYTTMLEEEKRSKA